jgi:hypothetical protein
MIMIYHYRQVPTVDPSGVDVAPLAQSRGIT